MSKAMKIKCFILRRKQVEARTGLSRSTIYLLIKKGTFPKPIKLSERSVGWIESEIDDWVDDKVQRRDHMLEADGCLS